MTALQVICMVAGSFGDSSATAALSATVQWLCVLRLVRLPRAFSIVKARLLTIPCPCTDPSSRHSQHCDKHVFQHRVVFQDP